MSNEYNYGPLEHELAGGTSADEPWCDDCRGYAHMPWCPSYEQPRPEQGSETSITKQSDLFPRYTFTVVTGRYKIIDNRSDSEPRVRQIATADGEDEARIVVRALNAAEQHSTLIAQRERLLEVARSALRALQDVRRSGCGLRFPLTEQMLKNVLTTIEQEDRS